MKAYAAEMSCMVDLIIQPCATYIACIHGTKVLFVYNCEGEQNTENALNYYNYFTENVTILFINNVRYKVAYKINTIIMTIIQNSGGQMWTYRV